MADYLLGLDYGTGGGKACIINTEGEVLGFGFAEYPFIHEKPGWSEHDPIGYWEVACQLIKTALDQARVNPVWPSLPRSHRWLWWTKITIRSTELIT
jgi:xylulokinase